MELLRGAHRDENLDGVMCRSLVSVDWQGYLYDCDFNQMLGLPLARRRPRARAPRATSLGARPRRATRSSCATIATAAPPGRDRAAAGALA